MSLIALIAIHWELCNKYSFTFSPEGINVYLTKFNQYRALFLATVTTIATYLGLHRLKAATEANNDKLRQDRFSEWKTVLDIRFIEIEKFDPYMKREFVKARYNFFIQLYNLNFTVSNKEQLTQIFNSSFQHIVRFFEEQNNKHIGMGGVYPDGKFSYSFNSFQFLFIGSIHSFYPKIEKDLQTLYLSSLDPNRTIDKARYQIALNNYIS